MSESFKVAALVGKFNSAGIAEPLHGLAQFLAARGLEVLVEAETARNVGLSGFRAVPASDIGKHADVVVAIGGDGTMLSIGRMIAAEVCREKAILSRAQALNDVVISRGAVGGMIELSVSIDDQFVSNQRSDGLILATPTGSTAYALSANGPILHPRVGGFVLVPVSPHALTNRPIVVSDSSRVVVTLTRGKDCRAHFDGQSDAALIDGDRVVLRRSEHVLRLLHPRGYNYFAMLRQKLHWSTIP